MSYTPPGTPFVNNTDPVGVGNGQSLDASFFTALVAGVDDADSRITALEGAPAASTDGRAVALNLILGS